MVKDYAKLFEHIVTETANYVTQNKLQAMVLGISGGIDSTVCASICHEVSKRTGVPLIGRSLPTTNNKTNEVNRRNTRGNIGVMSSQELIEKERKLILDIDRLILDELEVLFMQVF